MSNKINISSFDNKNGITLKKKESIKNNILTTQNLNELNELNAINKTKPKHLFKQTRNNPAEIQRFLMAKTNIAKHISSSMHEVHTNTDIASCKKLKSSSSSASTHAINTNTDITSCKKKSKKKLKSSISSISSSSTSTVHLRKCDDSSISSSSSSSSGSSSSSSSGSSSGSSKCAKKCATNNEYVVKIFKYKGKDKNECGELTSDSDNECNNISGTVTLSNVQSLLIYIHIIHNIVRDELAVIKTIYTISKHKCVGVVLEKMFVKYNYNIEQLQKYAKMIKKYVDDNSIDILHISTYMNLLKNSRMEGLLITYNCNIADVIEKMHKNNHYLHKILAYTKFYLNYV